MRKALKQLTDEQKEFLSINRDQYNVDEFSAMFEVKNSTILDYIKTKAIKIKRKIASPKPRDVKHENGIFNVDIYRGQYSWIM